MSTILRSYDVTLQLNMMQRQHLCFYLAALEGVYLRVVKRYELQLSLLKKQKKYLNASLAKQEEMVLRRSKSLGIHSCFNVVGARFLT